MFFLDFPFYRTYQDLRLHPDNSSGENPLLGDFTLRNTDHLPSMLRVSAT